MATKKKKNVKKMKTAGAKKIKKPVKKAGKKKPAPKPKKKPTSKKTAAPKAVKKNAAKKAAPKKKPAAKKIGSPVKAGTRPAPSIDYTKAVTPLGDRMVVRVLGGERITAGGLIIPDTATMATGYLKALVLAVGNGAKSKKGHLQPLDVKIGDIVLFAEHAGVKVRFNSEDLQIIHETDVMGVVQN